MRKTLLAWTLCLVAASAVEAELVSWRWAAAKAKVTHPGTIELRSGAKSARLVCDLSALPAGAVVRRASLHCFTAGGQPASPVRVLAPDGAPLKLQPPRFGSFDVTAAVRRWADGPRRAKLTFTVERFDKLDAGRTFLDVRFEGKAGDLPPPVTRLRAVHHDGQTFLIWRELPMFRPAAKDVFWMAEHAYLKSERADGPGKGFAGFPRIPAVTLKTLRDLKGLSVRSKKAPRAMEPIRVVKDLPLVRYRVYRSAKAITPATIDAAERVGEAAPCNAYVERMLTVVTHGEYYDPYESPESVIMTWCYDDSKPVMPGEAFYCHTPAAPAEAHYAVTVVRDGTEDLTRFAATAAPVAEKPATPRPILQFVKKTIGYTYKPGKYESLAYWYALWLAPPLTNLADNDPRHVVVGMPPNFAQPGPMKVSHASPGMFFEGPLKDLRRAPDTLVLFMAGGRGLAYSSGRGTLRSYSQCPADYFDERYTMAVIDWAMGQWKIDRSRITAGTSTHFAIRHPELFGIKHIGPFSMDFDSRWNPASGLLGGRLGPAKVARTVDGHLAWDIFSIGWYMGRDPGKDIPFIAVYFTQPKDGNHGAEYGWQDDPKGLAALRDYRQPHVAQWGGASVSAEVKALLAKLRWDRSVPAFANCSLDNNPGTGDPDAGDPWGQINGWLLWDYDSIVDRADRWEMTVWLAPSCPEDRCTVDLTPRRRKAFNPKPGEKLTWSNRGESDKRDVGSGTIAADQHGLATLKGITVTKGRNRIVIRK